MVIFFQEFVQLGHSKAVLRISMSDYAWNWSKSLWWCGAVGGWVVCKPILVFSFFQAEQNAKISSLEIGFDEMEKKFSDDKKNREKKSENWKIN